MLGYTEALLRTLTPTIIIINKKDEAQTGYYITSFRKSNSRFGLRLCLRVSCISVCKYHGYAARCLRSHNKSLRYVGRLGRA